MSLAGAGGQEGLLFSPLPEPLGLPPPAAPTPPLHPCCQLLLLLPGRVSPPPRLAMPAPHTGAISSSCFGSGARGKGRQGQMGSFFILLPPSRPSYPCPESIGGHPAPFRQCQHQSIYKGGSGQGATRKVLALLLPFRSPQAWAAAPCPPCPSITVLVLLRKASPAIMFYSHFLRLWDGARWGVVPRAWTLYRL